MRKIPAVSELLSAIIIIASMAVAAGILYGIFAERASDTTDNISSNIDRSMQKAKELLAVSYPVCTPNGLVFIIHNYSDDANLQTDQIMFYEIKSTGEPEAVSTPDWFNFDNTPGDGTFHNGTSMRVTITMSDCGNNELLIVTPAGEYITIQP